MISATIRKERSFVLAVPESAAKKSVQILLPENHKEEGKILERHLSVPQSAGDITEVRGIKILDAMPIYTRNLNQVHLSKLFHAVLRRKYTHIYSKNKKSELSQEIKNILKESRPGIRFSKKHQIRIIREKYDEQDRRLIRIRESRVKDGGALKYLREHRAARRRSRHFVKQSDKPRNSISETWEDVAEVKRLINHLIGKEYLSRENLDHYSKLLKHKRRTLFTDSEKYSPEFIAGVDLAIQEFKVAHELNRGAHCDLVLLVARRHAIEKWTQEKIDQNRTKV